MSSEEQDQDIPPANRDAKCEGGVLSRDCGEVEPRRDDGRGEDSSVEQIESREVANQEVDCVAAAVADVNIVDSGAAEVGAEADPEPPVSSPQEGTTDGEAVSPQLPCREENDEVSPSQIVSCEAEAEGERDGDGEGEGDGDVEGSGNGDGNGDVSSPPQVYRGGSSCDEADGEEGDDPSNLIINYVPDITEEKLASYFSPYGPLRSVKIVRDKRTGKTQGYAFVHFWSADDAANAMRQTNRLPIVEEIRDASNRVFIKEKKIKVAVARKRGDEIKNCKLVIKGTPPPEVVSDTQMAEILSHFGNIVEVRLVRSRSNVQMCFVQYRTRAEAESALARLHNSTINDYPLEVEFATPNYNSISAANSAMSSPMNSPPTMSPYTSPQEHYRSVPVGGAYGYLHPQGTMAAPRLGFATAPGAANSYAHHPAAPDGAHAPAGHYANAPMQLQVQVFPQQIQHTQPPHQSPQQQHGTVSAQPAERTHFLQQQKQGTPPAQYRQAGSPRAQAVQKASPQAQAQGQAKQHPGTMQQQLYPQQIRMGSGASPAQHYGTVPPQPQQSPQAYQYQQPPQSPQQQASPAQTAYHLQQHNAQHRNPAGVPAAPHFALHQQLPASYGPGYSPTAPQQAFPGAPQQPYVAGPPQQPYPHGAPLQAYPHGAQQPYQQQPYPHGHGAPQQAYPYGAQPQYQQQQARGNSHQIQMHQQPMSYSASSGPMGNPGQGRAVGGPSPQQQSRTNVTAHAHAPGGGGPGRGVGAGAGRGQGGRKKTTLRSMPDATSQPSGAASTSSRQQATAPGSAPNAVPQRDASGDQQDNNAQN